MAQLLFANNATTTLAGAVSSTSTSLALATGSGALFPNPAAGQYFVGTINSTTVPGLLEIVWCTARSGDTLTIVRAQEGTTGSGFNSGDTFSGLCTAGMLGAFVQTALLIAPGWTIYQTPGTYAFSPPATTALALVWGPGGGGGGCSGNNYATGGGAGAFAAKFFSGLSNASPITVTVGTGGSGGTAGGGNGGTGTSSSFGILQAFGGQGGNGNGSGGGVGGNAFNGDINMSGVGGGFGLFTTAPNSFEVLLGGPGGSTWMSPASAPGVNANGNGGAFPGVGGNGAASNIGTGYAGGPGANGMVIALWFH